MAIIKLISPVGGIRGTVNGMTFSENQSGPYVKGWAGPSQPRTARQMQERSNWGTMPALWNTTSAAQKTAWAVYAAAAPQELTNPLGETYFANGFNWFVRINTHLLRMSLSTSLDAPTTARPGAPTIDDFRVQVAGTEIDLCVGGGAAASSTNPGFPATNAFDDSIVEPDLWRAIGGVTAAWLQYTFTGAVNIQRYRIYPRAIGLNTAPADWTFEVFSTGTWHILQTVTSESYAVAQWFDYYVPSHSFSSSLYRINMTATQGGAQLAIMEMEMYAGAVGSSAIIYPTGTFSATPNLDLVLHVAFNPSIGSSVQYAGYKEVLVSDDPGIVSMPIQDEMTDAFGTILLDAAYYARLFKQHVQGQRSAAGAFRTEVT